MYDWHKFSCDVAATMRRLTCASTPSGVPFSTSSCFEPLSPGVVDAPWLPPALADIAIAALDANPSSP